MTKEAQRTDVEEEAAPAFVIPSSFVIRIFVIPQSASFSRYAQMTEPKKYSYAKEMVYPRRRCTSEFSTG
jgi:hypothetical protein